MENKGDILRLTFRAGSAKLTVRRCRTVHAPRYRLQRGSMTKQMKAAISTMFLIGTLPMVAQTSQTDVVKVAPGQTKKTVIHRKNGATDTVISEGTAGGGTKRHGKRRAVRSPPAKA